MCNLNNEDIEKKDKRTLENVEFILFYICFDGILTRGVNNEKHIDLKK